MRGANIDDAKIPAAEAAEAIENAEPVRYLHPERRHVDWLDKVISFDDAQHSIYLQAAPLIIVGSAGKAGRGTWPRHPPSAKKVRDGLLAGGRRRSCCRPQA